VTTSLVPGTAYASEETLPPDCGRLRITGQHGPFDYRAQTAEQKDLVEAHHFDTEYQAYLRGEEQVTTKSGRGSPVLGFDYTLRAFPNQYRALAAMDKISLKQGTDRPRGSTYTVRCWFERAVAFVPDDALVRAMYAVYLSRRGREKAATEQIGQAVQMGSDSANVMIQVAFAYMNLKDYENAQKYAERAYELGYPVFGLRDQLRAMGKWK